MSSPLSQIYSLLSHSLQRIKHIIPRVGSDEAFNHELKIANECSQLLNFLLIDIYEGQIPVGGIHSRNYREYVSQTINNFRSTSDEQPQPPNDEQPDDVRRIRRRTDVNNPYIFTVDNLNDVGSLFDIMINVIRDTSEDVDPDFIPLTQQEIANNITTHVYNQNGSEEVLCPIMLEPLKTGDEVMTINKCHHVFMKGALIEHLKNDDKCPSCRQSII